MIWDLINFIRESQNMSLSHSVFKPYLQNYHNDGTGRDTYVQVND